MSRIAPAAVRRYVYPIAAALIIVIVVIGYVVGTITLTAAGSILAIALPPLGLASANVTDDDS